MGDYDLFHILSQVLRVLSYLPELLFVTSASCNQHVPDTAINLNDPDL